MININYQFFLTVSIILLGYIAKRFKLVDGNAGDGVAKIIFNFTLPAVIITSLGKEKIEPSILLLAGISFSYGCIMALAAWIIFRKTERKVRGMLSMLLPGLNIGLFAYPFVEAFWGSEGIRYFSVFDAGNALSIFGLSYLLGSWFSRDSSEVRAGYLFSRMLRSVPLIVYILSIGINLMGFTYPAFVMDVAGVLSKANTPLSLLTLGIFLSFSLEFEILKNAFKVIFVRLGAGLAAGLFMYHFLPLGIVARQAMLIVFVMPISFSVVTYAVMFDYDRVKTATIVNISVVMSLVLMFVMLSSGMIT